MSISPWSEVRNGKLVRYIVHADRRIVRLVDRDAGAAPEEDPSIVPPTTDRSPGRWLLRLQQMVFGVCALLMLALCSALRRRWRWLAPLMAALVVASCHDGGRGGRQADQHTNPPAAEDVAAVTALLAYGLPNKLGLLTAALAGVATGLAAESMIARRKKAEA